MTKDGALKLKLDALIHKADMNPVMQGTCYVMHPDALQAVIDEAIKQARLAPVQEPVADAMARYFRVCSSGGMPKKLQESVQNLVYDAERLGYFKATTPPAAQPASEEDMKVYRAIADNYRKDLAAAQRQWVGLAETDKHKPDMGAYVYLNDDWLDGYKTGMEYAEAKLKEKNT